MTDMKTNTIGVIVPVYNVEPYLHRCIDSILAQTYKNIQIILVDDGSTDNSGKICDEYAAQDDRIVVLHQKNQGQSAARNAGLDYLFANTDCAYINFVDSDDWIHPQMLEVLLQVVLENQVDVSICGFIRTAGEKIEVPLELPSVQVFSPEDFYAQKSINAVVVWGKMYNQTCFASIRYPVGQTYGEDAFVTNRILFQYEKVAFIDAPLYAYFQNPDSITRSSWAPARLVAIDAMFEQVTYFAEHHFDRAKQQAEKGLLWILSNQLISARKVGSKKHIIYLRKLLKKYIKKYKKELDLSPGHTCYYYEAAYPIGMKVYWLCRAVLKRMHIVK